jgi:hypothetical protein
MIWFKCLVSFCILGLTFAQEKPEIENDLDAARDGKGKIKSFKNRRWGPNSQVFSVRCLSQQLCVQIAISIRLKAFFQIKLHPFAHFVKSFMSVTFLSSYRWVT